MATAEMRADCGAPQSECAAVEAAETALAGALRARRWTVIDLAGASGCHPNTLYPLRAGRTAPTVKTALRVAAALRVAPAELFKEVAVGQQRRAVRGGLRGLRLAPAPPPPLPITLAEVLRRTATGDAAWRRRAACAEAPDPEVFWPPAGSDAEEQERAALRWCARCAVLGDCRDVAVRLTATADHGQVLGGLTGGQRAAMRASMRRPT